jgi:RNA polymerase sigma factor (TIGR02999 family)
MGSAKTVTVLLRDWKSGDPQALQELMPLVYAELHRLAISFMRGERPNHTFRPTELVSEAYVRLAESSQAGFNDRVHFFAVAARTMRHVLVDHARARGAAKRGDGQRPVTLEEAVVAADRPDAMLALDEAIAALEKLDDRKARVVEMHYFAGLTQDEIAEALDVHVNTVARDLRFSEAWIRRHLSGEAS